MHVSEIVSSIDLEKGPPSQEMLDQHEYETRNILPGTYHDGVVGLKLQRRPWLESLHQFMDPNITAFAMDPADRMNHFDIRVIHFLQSGKAESVIRCSTAEEFEVATSEDKERIGTIIIAKGISRAVIEALGTKFELEPEFFASQAPVFPPEYIRNAAFYTAECRRSYHIQGGLEEIFKLRRSETTTPRPVHVTHPDLPDVFGTEKISVYKRKGSKIGIILTDQLLSDTPTASYIPNPVTLIDDDTENIEFNRRWHQVSTRRKILSWLKRLSVDEAKVLFDDHQQLALQPVLRIVECEGIIFLAYARHVMKRMFWRRCDAQFPDDITFFLYVSRSLHRLIHEQRKLLKRTQRVAALRGGDDVAEQIQDLGVLAADMDGALEALKKDVTFSVGEASIREGKFVGWISKLAALFLPVSLLAQILSISDPGYVRWAILGGLSVPFVLFTTYWMFFWEPAYFNDLSMSQWKDSSVQAPFLETFHHKLGIKRRRKVVSR